MLDMIRWEFETDFDAYEKVDDDLRKWMRATKVDDFIGLWRRLMAEEARKETRTSDSGKDRAMRK
jgi:hypothetical protein